MADKAKGFTVGKGSGHRGRIVVDDLRGVSQQFVADFFGVTRRAVQKWECPRRDDSKYDLVAVAEWRYRMLEARAEEAMLAGESTAGLERYRRAKAGIAELDLAERSGQLVDRELVRGGLRAVADCWRRVSEDAERRFGGDVFEFLCEGLEEMKRALGKSWLVKGD